ncbi:MAG TPA: glycosyl hydrolase, partial [Saprospiraceae bacterium]|nr:glycosyl hydrolase [Saprospiraceae bacterium]
FYDRRNHENIDTDVYLAYSTDGGDHFTNVKISETPFTPNPQIFFGDYNDISAYDGQIRPIWTRLDGFKLSVLTALIEHK